MCIRDRYCPTLFFILFTFKTKTVNIAESRFTVTFKYFWAGRACLHARPPVTNLLRLFLYYQLHCLTNGDQLGEPRARLVACLPSVRRWPHGLTSFCDWLFQSYVWLRNFLYMSFTLGTSAHMCAHTHEYAPY